MSNDDQVIVIGFALMIVTGVIGTASLITLCWAGLYALRMLR